MNEHDSYIMTLGIVLGAAVVTGAYWFGRSAVNMIYKMHNK